mmetsp:Transcript_78889/g.150099  ORF Transcript_78889/g.150099 Transcript_78889/m.150099 type:complete len:531 (+) Transcript_78889:58-1650(+)
MLGRAVATHAAVVAVAVVSLQRRARSKRGVCCQASSAEIKRDFFIFQNPGGLQDYAYKGLLGDGGFSSVSLFIHKRTGQPRAIKKIRRLGTSTRQFQTELQALISLDHPHIVKVLEYFEDPAHFHVVFELCSGNDLLTHFSQSNRRRDGVKDVERDASIVLRQSLNAVVGCHAKGLIHRDLKPENFLLVGKDLTVKLIDFGLATRCGEGELARGIYGTLGYMAPEVLLNSEGYEKAADIWSLGAILFVLLTSEPFLADGEERELMQDERYMRQRVRSCHKLAENSSDAVDLLEKMLEWDPKKRISALQILQHPFITAHGGEQLCNRSGSTKLQKPLDCKLDKRLPSKMERYAKSPRMRQIGLRCLVHLASNAALPQDLLHEIFTARHHFRSLNPSGTGWVSEHQLRMRLEEERIPVPSNFGEICKDCQHASHGLEVLLDYDVFLACLLIDAPWPDVLFREVFIILDRSRDGVIALEDLIEFARADHSKGCEAIFREVDPEGSGYINYDKFMSIMEADEPLFEWFVPTSQS